MDVTRGASLEPSESQVRPLTALLDAPRIVEVMLNADGVVWVDRIGEGLLRTPVTMGAGDAERMLRLVASEVGSGAQRADALALGEAAGSVRGALKAESVAPAEPAPRTRALVSTGAPTGKPC
jgi:Flp pilus assembly CpaF family ATPase